LLSAVVHADASAGPREPVNDPTPGRTGATDSRLVTWLSSADKDNVGRPRLSPPVNMSSRPPIDRRPPPAPGDDAPVIDASRLDSRSDGQVTGVVGNGVGVVEPAE
jgi:hypothetical protein